jgi:single-strand DNA-binding protein
MNNWTFTGNLGGDAEVRFTAKQEPIANFNVAVKSGFGDKAVTTWVKCSLFGKRAESLAPHLVKGTQVCVSGSAALKTWTAKDGTEKKDLEVRVNEVDLISGKKDSPSPAKQSSVEDEFSDDPPF